VKRTGPHVGRNTTCSVQRRGSHTSDIGSQHPQHYTRAVTTVHLVVGSTGAGKSTFSRELARDERALRFAIDEWMANFYFPDRPSDADFEWYWPRIERCTRAIWSECEQALALGVPVVLEIGLTRRSDRAQFCEKVTRDGHSLQLHVVEAPLEERWARVQRRNQDKGETFSLEVTRGMFDFVETMWEAPTDEELAQYVGQRHDTSGTREANTRPG